MVNLLAKKAMIVSLNIALWGARQTEQDVTDEVMSSKGAKNDYGNFTKRLLSKDAMGELKRIRHQARKYHIKNTLLWLHDGSNILPSARYLEYAQAMRKFQSDYETEIAKFIKAYPKFIGEAKKELGKLFNPEDYPSVETVKRKFGFKIDISPIPDKDDFRVSLDNNAMQEIKANLDKTVSEQYERAMNDLGNRLLEVVGHMATKLAEYKPSGDGKKTNGLFRDSLVENVRSIAELLPEFNLNGDPRLTKLHARIQKELCVHEAWELRENPSTRKKVRNAANDIVKAVNEFLA